MEIYGVLFDPSLTNLGSILKHSINPSGEAVNHPEPREAPISLATIPEDEVVTDDDYLALPFWCAPDSPSAIATTLERMAVFTAQHGHETCACYELIYVGWKY